MRWEYALAASVPDAVEADHGWGQLASLGMMSDFGSPPEHEWFPLPGARGSQVRKVEAAAERGLMFFPWGNFRRLDDPDGKEYTLEFENVGATGPGIRTEFVLDWTDAFIMCPAKFVWPVCVLCTKFLFPHEDHRRSKEHQRRLRQPWPLLADKEQLKSHKAWCCRNLPRRNDFGVHFGLL